MHWPGIEPGPPAWQARILPLNHQCLCRKSVCFALYICTVSAGSTSWLSNVSFQPRLAEDVQQAFDSASITGERHDKGLGFVPKKRHTEQSDKHAGTSDHEEHLHKKKKRKKDRKHGPKQHSPSPPPSGWYRCTTAVIH